jgi:5'-3' exonuclease
MGIKNLHSFLRKRQPNLYRQKTIDNLIHKKIAVDTSIYMCKFKSSFGTKWLKGFFDLICLLRKHSVDIIFIFDSKAPPEKDLEREHRLKMREKNRLRITNIMEEWERYVASNESLDNFPLLKKLSDRKRKKYAVVDDDIMKQALYKLQNNLVFITGDDFELLKQLLTIMGIPFDYATSEAEGTCALLNCMGIVDGVLTEDTDVLAYGANVMLHNFSLKDNTFMEIHLSDILEAFQISFAQFKDFCIMCGTDYNHNIPQVGPMKAFELILREKTLDEIANKIDVTSLNYKRVRTLLDCYQNSTQRTSIQCVRPDFLKMKRFCFYNNIAYEEEQIESLDAL